MKLKDKPAVFSRISLLLQHSNEFRNYMLVPGTTGVDVSEELKLIRRDTGKVIDYFSLAENENQKQIAEKYLKSIEATAWLGFLLREVSELEAVPSTTGLINMDFAEEEIVIKIKAPITKSEFYSLWKSICGLQLNFLYGFSDDMLETEQSCLKELNRVFKKYGKEDLVFNELKGIEMRSTDIWKKNPKEQLDEDLLILRLSRSNRMKVAESQYKKIKLFQFLKDRQTQISPVDANKNFSELCYKYYPESKNMSDRQIEKKLRFKPFNQRVQKTKEAWGLSA